MKTAEADRPRWVTLTLVGTVLGSVASLLSIVVYFGLTPPWVKPTGSPTGPAPTTQAPPTTHIPPTTLTPPTPAPTTGPPPETVPPTVPPTVPAPFQPVRDARGWSAADYALFNTLARSVFPSCYVGQTRETADMPAALNCATATAGPDLQPLVMQFSRQEPLEAYLETVRSRTDNAGECSAGEAYVGRWHRGGSDETVGALVCGWDDDGYYRITWAYDSHDIVAVASSRTSSAIWEWWKANCGQVIYLG
jgi:hypothetical protein